MCYYDLNANCIVYCDHCVHRRVFHESALRVYHHLFISHLIISISETFYVYEQSNIHITLFHMRLYLYSLSLFLSPHTYLHCRTHTRETSECEWKGNRIRVIFSFCFIIIIISPVTNVIVTASKSYNNYYITNLLHVYNIMYIYIVSP